MSRSRKKFPKAKICITRAGEEKRWKRRCNKILRGVNEVSNGGWYRKVTDPWGSPSDGKWWIDRKSKQMRK